MMNQTSDNFRDLQRLLSLKNHEQPPPGYFEDFSARVILRLEASCRRQQDSLWLRWFRSFDVKPILVCAYGLAIGGTLLFGFSFFGMGEGNPKNISVAQGVWLTGGVSVPISFKNDASNWRDLDEVSGASLLPAAVARRTDVPTFLFDGSGVKPQAANYLFRSR